MAKKQIPEYLKELLQGGVISKEQLLDAQKQAKQTGKTIAQTIVQLEYASDEDVMKALAKAPVSYTHLTLPTKA